MEFDFRVNGTCSNPHIGKMMMVEDSDSDIHAIRGGGGGGGCSSSTITDSLKETMISQEGVLQKQIFELHRLYGIQKNLMEKFDCCKKIDNFGLWNASAQTRYSFGGEDNNDFPAFPMVFSAQALLQRNPIDLQLSVLDQVSNKEYLSCDVSTQNPVIDLEEEPVDDVSNLYDKSTSSASSSPANIYFPQNVVNMKKDDDSCILTERTSCYQGLDLNKQPEDDNSDLFMNSNSSSGRIDYGNETWQIDLNSVSMTQSEMGSCSGNSKYLARNNTDISISNTMETNNKDVEEDGNCKISEIQIAKSKSEVESIDEKGADESRVVMDLGILDAVESLMSMFLSSGSPLAMDVDVVVDDDDGEIQPERSLDSYELIVLNLEECSSSAYEKCVVSSKEKVMKEEEEESPIKLRRGKRRIKDFRKDVLPSMACLSRHEIQEDVNIMEAVIRSREYKNIMRTKTTNVGGDKWFTPVKKRSRRSKQT
ncbi:uncharacterized protein LOC124910242 isoform X2 [Impatiens glandulifera]|nr:uncharacterized protein LOC124910242 isoform X2 [Impatiens glandulifera]